MEHNIDQQRRAGALHEAAHAVIAVQYRSRIRERGVSIDDLGCGEVHLQRRTDPQTIARIRELGGEIWDLHQQLAREEILISLAGPVAEAMLMNADLDDPDFWDVFTDDPLADFYHAGELLEALYPEAIDDDNASDALRSKYVQGTHNLLRRPATWNAVRKVADRLQESGHLDADEATATIEASYSGSRSRKILIP